MDTVVYKLHHPERYPIIIKAVQDLREGKGVMLIPDRPEYRKETKFTKIWANLKLDAYSIMTYNVDALLPSSATGISIMYDEQKEYIKFELSIPKFFFGNNVCELIAPFQSRHHNMSVPNMEQLARYWYNILKNVFYKIILDLTGGLFTDFSWCDVQVARIDIAYNQLFDTEKDALHYLESIKKVTIPRLREHNKVGYGTATTFKSDDYYFKVYHKGAEFAKIGSAQIQKKFDEYFKQGLLHDKCPVKKSHDNKSELQQLADRTLRYELESKNGLLKRLFNKHLKKQKIPAYQLLRKHVLYVMDHDNYSLIRQVQIRYRDLNGGIFREMRNPLMTYESVYYLPLSYFEPATESREMVPVTDTKLNKRIERISMSITLLKKKYFIVKYSQLKQVHKFILKEDDMHHQFFFEIEEVDSAKAIERKPGFEKADKDGVMVDCMTLLQETPKAQKFSRHLLLLCIRAHNHFFKELQFEKLPTGKDLELLATEYNERINNALIDAGKKPKKVNVRMVANMVKQCLKHTTWSEMRKTGDYDRTTLWRQQRKLEEILGFGKSINFISGIGLENIVRDPLRAYFRHYNELLENKNPLLVFLQNTPLLLQM